MAGFVAGLSIAVASMVTGALAGRCFPRRWAPGILGGIAGAFGDGALRFSGYGDIDLLSLVSVIIVYGVLVGLTAMVPALAGMTCNLPRRDHRAAKITANE